MAKYVITKIKAYENTRLVPTISNSDASCSNKKLGIGKYKTSANTTSRTKKLLITCNVQS